MQIRSFILLVVLVLTAAFAALNWQAFIAPTQLSLGFGSVQAPLGVIMLSVLGLLTVVFLAWVVYLQGSVLLDTRRQAKELQAQRELADKAEASRFTELRGFISDELARMQQAADASRASLLARIDELDQRSRQSLEDASNSLSAYIGELEDRLDPRWTPPDVPRVTPRRIP